MVYRYWVSFSLLSNEQFRGEGWSIFNLDYEIGSGTEAEDRKALEHMESMLLVSYKDISDHAVILNFKLLKATQGENV